MKRAILSLSLVLVSVILILSAPTAHGLFPMLSVHADATTPDYSNLCKSAGSGTGDCESCFQGGGAWTAIGCIGKGTQGQGGGTLNDFLRGFLSIGIGMGGGIAFLLILYSGLQTMLSAGNPEKLHEAKELMTAAISGLLLIIFSVFLLKLIGVDILQLPGLG